MSRYVIGTEAKAHGVCTVSSVFLFLSSFIVFSAFPPFSLLVPWNEILFICPMWKYIQRRAFEDHSSSTLKGRVRGGGEPSHSFRWVSGTQSEQAWFPSQTQFGPLWDAVATRLWFLVEYVHSKGCNYRMQTVLLMSSQDNSSAQSQCRFSLKTPRKEVSEQYWKWTTGSSRDCLSYFESFFFVERSLVLKASRFSQCSSKLWSWTLDLILYAHSESPTVPSRMCFNTMT